MQTWMLSYEARAIFAEAAQSQSNCEVPRPFRTADPLGSPAKGRENASQDLPQPAHLPPPSSQLMGTLTSGFRYEVASGSSIAGSVPACSVITHIAQRAVMGAPSHGHESACGAARHVSWSVSSVPARLASRGVTRARSPQVNSRTGYRR